MGQNGAAFGQLPHFGPFPLEKISKRGAKKVENQPSTFTKYTFQTSRWFGIKKEVLPSCLGWKEALVGEWWPKMWKLSAKIWTGIPPRPLGSNFVDHLVMFIKHSLHQKGHIPGHLLRRPPLGNHQMCIYNSGRPYKYVHAKWRACTHIHIWHIRTHTNMHTPKIALVLTTVMHACNKHGLW